MSAMRTEKKQVFYLLHYSTHGHVRKNPPRSSKAIHGAGRRWVRKVLRVIGGLTREGGSGFGGSAQVSVVDGTVVFNVSI